MKKKPGFLPRLFLFVPIARKTAVPDVIELGI